jgi:hypothetical protein
MYSFSWEQLGTTAYAYLTPIGPTGARSRGKGIGDFSLLFVNPSKVDITASTAITVVEYDAGESVTHGSYRFSVPLPSTGEGNYSLRITDEFGQKHNCVFMAYNFPPHMNTADSSAQVEIEAFEADGTPVSSLTLAELDTYIFNPSLQEVSDESSVGLTLSKIEDGKFLLEWDCSSEEGEWFMDVINSDYFAGGQQAIWKYSEKESYDSPSIEEVEVSDDGLTVTVDVIAGGAPYIVAQLLSSTGILRDEDLRSGSGVFTLTRTVVETGMLIVWGADEDGYPFGDPVGQAVPTTLVPPSGGADDNVRVAVRTMQQTAVYWARTGMDSYGKPTYDDPTTIACRWDDVQEEFIAPNGDRELSKARLIVDRDLTIKGVLLLGDLDSIVDDDDPKDNDGAWEIRGTKKTPNFKGTKYLREVYL